MRSLFTYSLLVVQLVLVRLVTAKLYTVSNVHTDFDISRHGVVAGGEVQTSRFNGIGDNKALPLFIYPSLDLASTNKVGIVDVKTTLWVGLDPNPTPGSRLKWVQEEFYWEFFRVANSFVLFPPDTNYFWFDNFSIPTVIEVDEAQHVVNSTDYMWNFTPYDSSCL